MRNLPAVTALLLCSLCWISVSGFESQIVEVQPGEDVTLMCSNFSSVPSQIFWFKLAYKKKPQCVSQIFSALEPASFCDGFQNGRFETNSNVSNVFLKLKQVDLSDSGLYFCGYYMFKNLVIEDATVLEVQGVFEGKTTVAAVILGGLTIFLVMVVICLAVKIKNLRGVHVGEQSRQQTENGASDDLNYAAVTFRPKTKSNHRPESQVETHVIYSRPDKLRKHLEL